MAVLRRHVRDNLGLRGFQLFTIGRVALSVVFTWVYDHTSRSILGIVLLHGWTNVTAEAVEVSDVFYYSHWVAFAAVLTVIWVPEILRRGKSGASTARRHRPRPQLNPRGNTRSR